MARVGGAARHEAAPPQPRIRVMSMNPMHPMDPLEDETLDRAIDRAARELTAGEPNASFRTRVMDRIGERSTWRSPWVWAPIAAAAVVAIAVMPRGPQRAEPPVLLASHSTSLALSVCGLEPTLAREALVAPVSGNVPGVVPRDAAPRVRRPRSADSAVAALAPDPLSTPSLAVDPIGPADSIRVTELETITTITVAPIGEPQGERR